MHESRMVPVVTETSTVAEMIKFLKCSFTEDDFALVERIFSRREHRLKMELEKLRDQCSLLEKERDNMVAKHDLAVLENRKLDDEVITSKKKCEVLKETNERLNADNNQVLRDEQEWFHKLGGRIIDIEKELSQIKVQFRKEMARKNQMIAGLNERLEVLEKEKNQQYVDLNEEIVRLNCEKIEIEGEKKLYKKKFEKVHETVLKYELLNEKFSEFEKEYGKIRRSDVVGVDEEEGNVSKGNTLNVGDEPSANQSVRNRGRGSGVHEIPDAQKKGTHLADLDCDNKLLSRKLLICEGGCSSNMIPSCLKLTGLSGSAPIIVDLCESDDDVPTGLPTCIGGERGMASEKPEKNEYSGLDNEQTRRDHGESYFSNFCAKTERSTSVSEDDDDDIPIAKLWTRKGYLSEKLEKNECSGLDIAQTRRDRGESYFANFCAKRKSSTSESEDDDDNPIAKLRTREVFFATLSD